MSRLFGPIRQNGYVVKDIEAALEYWVESTGVGPWFLVEKVELDWFRHRGEKQSPELSIALANSGDLQIELIQQRDQTPTMYREFLDAGHEGLQHVAFWSTEYQALYDDMLAKGYALGHEGQIGGERGRFAYFESSAHPGSVIEISDISGPKGELFDFIRKAAVGWDGKTPIHRL